MPEYAYTAVDAAGNSHGDRVIASSASEARQLLSDRGLKLQHLEFIADPQAEREGIRGAAARLVGGLIPGAGPYGSAFIAGCYRDLAIMLDAGIDIRRGLATIAGQQSRRDMVRTRLLDDIRKGVDSGDSLSVAMARHEEAFGEMDLRAIEAAERAGVLEDSLKRLAESHEAGVRLRKQIISALSYPAVVVAMAVVITLLVMTFVVPILLETIATEGGALPLPTRIVKGFSDLLLGGWWLILLVLVGLFLGLRKLLGTREGRRLSHVFVLQIPVIGPMVEKHALAKASILLSTMIRCGINFLEALEVTARACRVVPIRRGLERWREAVAEGAEIDEGLIKARGFPPLMIEMVGVGATSGQVDKMLDKLATTYENDVDELSRRLGTLVEPALLLFLGGLVLLIALAVLLPILEIQRVFAP